MEQNTLRRAFDLLENDAASLDARRLAWETIVDGNSKWVLIKGFPIPAGYNVSEAEIALMLRVLSDDADRYGLCISGPESGE